MKVRQAVAPDIPPVIALDLREFGSDGRAAGIKTAVAEGNCLVAEADGQIIGFAIIHRNFFDHPFIALVMVAHDDRRRGAGTALLHACKTYAPGKLFTSTNQSNTAMQGLLRKAGFIRCGYIDGLDEGDPELIYCGKKESP